MAPLRLFNTVPLVLATLCNAATGASSSEGGGPEDTYVAAYEDVADFAASLQRRQEENDTHTPLPRYRTSDGRVLTYPLFLLLGTQKGGTTGLRRTLSNHPDLRYVVDAASGRETQSAQCETHYFNKKIEHTPAGKHGLAPPAGRFDAAPPPPQVLASALAEYMGIFSFEVRDTEPEALSARQFVDSEGCVESSNSAWVRDLVDETVKSGRFMFDATPNYLGAPTAAYHIRQLLPRVRMVALLRDPYERYVSELNMRFCNEVETRPMYHPAGKAREYVEKAARLYPGYEEKCKGLEVSWGQLRRCDYRYWGFGPLNRGMYADQLERYFTLFGRSQFLIIHSDELFSDYAAVLQRVTHFVGLKSFDWNNLLKHFDTHGNPGDAQTRESMCPEHYAEFEEYLAASAATDDEAVLREFYRSHNERLFELLGVDFGWNERGPRIVGAVVATDGSEQRQATATAPLL